MKFEGFEGWGKKKRKRDAALNSSSALVPREIKNSA
jgi:hypothetical protein